MGRIEDCLAARESSTIDRSVVCSLGRLILLPLGIFSLKKRRFRESFVFGSKRRARLLKFLVASLPDLLVLVPAFFNFLISFGTLSDMSLRVNLPLLKLLVWLAGVLLLDKILVLNFYSHLSVTLSIRGLLLFLCSKRQTS